MSMKKKLGMGIGAAALGLSLIGGGTFAFFNDVEASNNTFAAGTLDLTLNPKTIIDVKDIKPGDTITKEFELKNTGSLDISTILLTTDYTVTDANGDNKNDDFGKHIRVKFLGKGLENYSLTLEQLKNTNIQNYINQYIGSFKPGDTKTINVQFEFVDNKQDQNKFQGDSLQLEWTFDAQQTAGTKK